MRVILILTLAIVAAGCGSGDSGSTGETDKLRVVAAFYPLAYAAEAVGGGGVAVENLTPPGVEPHDLELAPRDVVRIRSADVVLYLGGGFQPAVENAAADAGGKRVDLLEGDLDKADDPHVWLAPLLYAQLVERISTELTGSDEAAKPLVAKLEALDADYKEGLARCERRQIVVSHAAFGYLAEAYGLEQIPLAGLNPEAEATPQDLRRIAGLVEENGITTIFVEPLAAPDESDTIARETGTKTAVLDPLEGLTEEEQAAGEDYISVMESNLEALRVALGCR
jgi:zinc transport system substrate-binding protein